MPGDDSAPATGRFFHDLMATMNLTDHLLAAGDAAAPALICGPTIFQYGELREQVDRCARWLVAQGGAKGERVAILAENGVFFVVAYLGILRAGMVAVPIQGEASTETLDRIVRDAGIRRLFLSRRLTRRLAAWTRPAPLEVIDETELAGVGSPEPVDFPAIDPEQDQASLMYTSGSTGVPRGVVITHGNILTNTRDIVEVLGLTAADRVMVVLPFHYCYGLSLLHTHLAVGASLVINNQFLFPEQVLQEMQTRECTGLAGVPSTYQILLRKSRFKRMEFPALRWLQQAGGKLPNPFIQEILEAFPRVRFQLMYGQTEATARLSCLPPERLGDKLGSIGRGLPSTRLEVINADGGTVTPGSDEVGEIVASGGNISPGYWNDPEETARYFRGGRLHTGDLARVDADGFIFIVEREREMIKSGGNRVGAKEVEEIIAELPDVVEVAVVGEPHELLGEAIAAVVAPVAGCSLQPDQVREHCRRRLPAFKVPERVVFLPKLPHNGNGKVIKSELKKLLAAG